jgi:hypothetical protein
MASHVATVEDGLETADWIVWLQRPSLGGRRSDATRALQDQGGKQLSFSLVLAGVRLSLQHLAYDLWPEVGEKLAQ